MSLRLHLPDHVLVDIQGNVDLASRAKHLNSLDIFALIKPQKDCPLVMVRHEWSVSFSNAIQSGLALSRNMDDIVNRELPSFGLKSCLELQRSPEGSLRSR